MREACKNVHAFNVSEQHVERLHGEFVEEGERVERVETLQLELILLQIAQNRLANVLLHVLRCIPRSIHTIAVR